MIQAQNNFIAIKLNTRNIIGDNNSTYIAVLNWNTIGILWNSTYIHFFNIRNFDYRQYVYIKYLFKFIDSFKNDFVMKCLIFYKYFSQYLLTYLILFIYICNS